MYEVYKELRDKKGLTDYKVSQLTGIPRSTLTEWKSGKYTPKIEKLHKLALFFDVPLEVFMNEDASEQRPIEEVRVQAEALKLLGVDPSSEEYNEDVKKLAHAMSNPKVAEFAKLVSQLSDEDVDKVYEVAQFLKMKELNDKQ